MMTSETRPGSTPARSSAALMAIAPRSWAGSEAKAPLKLPTGVRAALTMTTSSDMGISWELEFFENRQAPERRAYRPISLLILLTSLRHVNWPGRGFSPQRIQFGVAAVSLSSISAWKLTVPHKTVAEVL